ncbi:MAG: NHL repeat-containing protein [Chitinophagaceae bacterium]
MMNKKLFLTWTAMLFIVGCAKNNKYPLVTTYAGTGAMGVINGNRTSATFSYPMGLTVDASDNVYVADSHNNLIRKISADGMVTTFAGSGKVGSADGKAATASFFNPAAVAADNKGNIYVADTHNSLIRKINADGLVTTLAGKWPDGRKGPANGTAIFDNPMGLAVDAKGNVYAADWLHDQISKISPDGQVTILAGNDQRGSKNGTGSSASFYLPEGIAVDRDGNVYVADTYNNQIRKISPAGVVTTLAGKLAKGAANGQGTAASFSHPDGLAVDQQGNVYVADSGNNLIRKISPDGRVTTLAGCQLRGSANGNTELASFYRPMGVAVDKDGNVYIADYQNNMIRKVSF